MASSNSPTEDDLKAYLKETGSGLLLEKWTEGEPAFVGRTSHVPYYSNLQTEL